MAAFAGCLGYFEYDYTNPILGLRLINLGLLEQQVGLFFCITSVVYIFSSLVAVHLPADINKKKLIICGILASFPVNLMTGPS